MSYGTPVVGGARLIPGAIPPPVLAMGGRIGPLLMGRAPVVTTTPGGGGSSSLFILSARNQN